MLDSIAQVIYKWDWLYKYHSRLIGFSFLFVYWDRYAEVLEFYVFGKVVYFHVKGKD